MNALPSSLGPTDGDIVEHIARALRTDGYIVIPNALPPDISDGLFQRILALGEEDYQQAGIGRNDEHHLNPFVRQDEIRWLTMDDPAEQALLGWMEQLRLGLNRRLYLGLFDYECHFAHYPPGAFYKRHLDAFRGRTNRVVTTVLYLNPGWTTADGGELLIYSGDDELPFQRVLPLFGTLVVFLSDEYPHEVLRANRDRYSLAGWFRINNTAGQVIDPPLWGAEAEEAEQLR